MLLLLASSLVTVVSEAVRQADLNTDFDKFIENIKISRHTVMCHVTKKAGDHILSILTEIKETAFLCMHSSMAPSLKHTIFAL